MKQIKVQEIFVKIKFSPEVLIHKRTFAWRTINFNKLMMKNVSIDQEKGEASFTSEFNIELSKEAMEKAIKNHLSFTTGEGVSTKFIEFELIELKEEKEIYGNK